MKTFFPYPFYPDDVPIDISFIFEDERPAGKHGFLGVDGRSLCFEDGTVAKFWGTNFNGAGCFPEHAYAEKLAKRLSKLGINLVRFHQLDSEWHTPNIFAFTKGKKMPGGTLDPESMDRLDYLIYCLKKEGIYVYLDMLTYRKFKEEDGVRNAVALGNEADVVPAVAFIVAAVKMGGGLSLEIQLAAFIGQNAAQHMGQGGFAAAAFAGDGHKFAPAEGQVHTIQTQHHRLGAGVIFAQIFQTQ